MSPVNGADAGHSVTVAHALGQQPVPDLPGEHGGVLPLVVCDFVHHLRGGHLGLGAANDARLDAASLIVTGEEKFRTQKNEWKVFHIGLLWQEVKRLRGGSPSQDLADAAVTDAQLSGDVTRPDPLVGHVHDALSDHLRKRAPIYKHAA